MDFALLNNLPFIHKDSVGIGIAPRYERICQYISHYMLLNSDPHLTAEVGAEHI